MKKLYILLFILFTLLTVNTRYTLSQWYQQTVPVSKPITGIKFIDSLKGWAIADIGTGGANYSYILHTTNGGTNWLLQDSSFGASLLALSVVDINIIYCGGFDGAATANLHKTTNGGINWILIPTPTNMSILDMQFINKDSGWTVGGSVGADVRTTTDGGQSWQVRTNGIASQTQRLFFLNYSTGFCGANNFLYKTTNAGVNWVQNAHFLEDVKSIYFFNENTGWIGASTSTLYKTTNGGVNWDTIILPPIFGNITDIQFMSLSKGYGGNRTLRILVTTNNGMDWGYQIDSSASYRISFVDTLKGWSGDFGISYTSNGGGPITYVGVVNINNEIPNEYILYQNYPNPFNSQTNIKFSLTKSAKVQFKIYDITGKEKSVWQSNTKLDAGTHELRFDANEFSSGIYFYQIIISDENGNIEFKDSKKMIVIK